MENVNSSSGIRAKAVGLLPISVTERANTSSGAKQTNQRSMWSKRKVIIRRLPPGLTQQDFEECLGEEWRASEKKLTWIWYKPGKISKDPSKPSTPSRAYAQLTDPSCFDALALKVRNTQFNDERRTLADPGYPGSPTIEFAPYERVPSTKRRHDARQGTIDQDPEFISFLESLTSPIVKATIQDSESGEKPTRITSTPLIQYLRDKKTAKEKNSTALKGAKQTKQSSSIESNTKPEAKRGEPKADTAPSKVSSQVSKSATSSNKPAKSTAAKTNATEQKGITQPNNVQKVNNTSSESITEKSIRTPSNDTNKTGASRQTSNKRASPNPRLMNPASVIQRDLGIGISPNSRKRTSQQNSTVTPDNDNGEVKNLPKVSLPPAPPALDAQKPTNPDADNAEESSSKKISEGVTAKPITSKSSQKSTSFKPPIPKTPKAFLKHANPSQGITELLIVEALSTFGAVKNVEIDKRKGFAYAQFPDVESLRSAMAASPIKVAQGSIQVLERKEKPSQNTAGNKGTPPVQPEQSPAPTRAPATPKPQTQPQLTQTTSASTKDADTGSASNAGRGRTGSHRGQSGRARNRGGSGRGTSVRGTGGKVLDASQSSPNEATPASAAQKNTGQT